MHTQESPHMTGALRSMQRILIIGSSGAGKSTLARQIGALLHISVTHLDRLFWQPGWHAISRDELRAAIAPILVQPQWIIDGNYTGTLEMRLAHADTLIWLDMPRWRCLWRVIVRRIQYHGRTRPDLSAGCPEQLSGELLQFIWRYPHTRRPALLRLVTTIPHIHVIVLRSPRQVAQFLAQIRCSTIGE